MYCEICGNEINENDFFYECNNEFYCEICGEAFLELCPKCLEYKYKENFKTVINEEKKKQKVCKDCIEKFYYKCSKCSFYFEEENFNTNKNLCIFCEKN